MKVNAPYEYNMNYATVPCRSINVSFIIYYCRKINIVFTIVSKEKGTFVPFTLIGNFADKFAMLANHCIEFVTREARPNLVSICECVPISFSHINQVLSIFKGLSLVSVYIITHYYSNVNE